MNDDVVEDDAGAVGQRDGGVVNADAATGPLEVIATTPEQNGLADSDTLIEIRFRRPVDRASVNADRFWAFAKASGSVQGAITFADGDRTVRLTPEAPLSAGEEVIVILAKAIQAPDGTPLAHPGYSFGFRVTTRASSLTLRQTEVIGVRPNPGTYSQAYGGIATDLNNDGFLDMAIVNENSDDLGIFLNDRSGSFADVLRPAPTTGIRASPAAPGDFDRDGVTDIVVVNIQGSVSIFLGNGDGSFKPQQNIRVGSIPRGVAVFDSDGDADLDIITTNAGSDELSLLLNDGSGSFGDPTFFDDGGEGGFALAGGDMNNDGIFDLIVGARDSENIIVHLGNGDGSFTVASRTWAAGDPRVVSVGDLNGDRFLDVAVANFGGSSGAILLGDGSGQLAPAQAYSADPRALGTDLADLDGDGDLDWILSSFGGDWRIFLNTGDGTFSFDREVPAQQAASWSLLFDLDNDGDIDLGLVDEIADTVTIFLND